MSSYKLISKVVQHSDTSTRKPGISIHPLYFTGLLLLVIAILIFRMDEFSYFPGKYLWAEDGSVFINGAQSLGVAALWKPYAGYVHAYPRLISLLANHFELIHRPQILLI